MSEFSTMLVMVSTVSGKPDVLIPIERMQRKFAIKKAHKLARLHPGTEYRVYVGWNSTEDTGNMSRSVTVFRGKR